MLLQTIVRTDTGAVTGVEDRGAVRFRGIPYAAAPFGPNRLRPPAPVAPWEGVMDTSDFGVGVPQVGVRGGPVQRVLQPAPAGRGLPDRRRVDPGRDLVRAAGHGLDPRRRVHHRHRIGAGPRRLHLRSRRHRPRRHQLPARRRRVHVLRRRHREPRAARPDRCARVGAAQHRRLRRRPGPGHHLRPVRRGRRRHRPPGHAAGARPVRAGDRHERLAGRGGLGRERPAGDDPAGRALRRRPDPGGLRGSAPSSGRSARSSPWRWSSSTSRSGGRSRSR